jgi:hypothetical protein
MCVLFTRLAKVLFTSVCLSVCRSGTLWPALPDVAMAPKAFVMHVVENFHDHSRQPEPRAEVEVKAQHLAGQPIYPSQTAKLPRTLTSPQDDSGSRQSVGWLDAVDAEYIQRPGRKITKSGASLRSHDRSLTVCRMGRAFPIDPACVRDLVHPSLRRVASRALCAGLEPEDLAPPPGMPASTLSLLLWGFSLNITLHDGSDWGWPSGRPSDARRRIYTCVMYCQLCHREVAVLVL